MKIALVIAQYDPIKNAVREKQYKTINADYPKCWNKAEKWLVRTTKPACFFIKDKPDEARWGNDAWNSLYLKEYRKVRD